MTEEYSDWQRSHAACDETSTVCDQRKCRPCIFPPQVTRPTSVKKPKDGAAYGNRMKHRPRDFPRDNKQKHTTYVLALNHSPASRK
jgi:hypothetical protein